MSRSFPDGKPRSLRKVRLVLVEGEKLLCADLAGDGNVKEIHRTDGKIFFRLRRNATESKSGGVPQSEDSDSANSFVIFGRSP